MILSLCSFILVMWWQYLQMRYMLTPPGGVAPIRMAFSQLDYQLLTLTRHKYCPGVVAKAYDFIRSQLKKRAEPPAPGATPRSMMPNCSVM